MTRARGVLIASRNGQKAHQPGLDPPDERRLIHREILFGLGRHPSSLWACSEIAPLLQAHGMSPSPPNNARGLEPPAHRKWQTEELVVLHHGVTPRWLHEKCPYFGINRAFEATLRRR